mmetsp:Transcript_11964/g.28326  ORF Transcript_11964/g.28326 Transcript_11964/m.28326 type:complete len:208 (-) Transcript_11964:1340-1963(-)
MWHTAQNFWRDVARTTCGVAKRKCSGRRPQSPSAEIGQLAAKQAVQNHIFWLQVPEESIEPAVHMLQAQKDLPQPVHGLLWRPVRARSSKTLGIADLLQEVARAELHDQGVKSCVIKIDHVEADDAWVGGLPHVCPNLTLADYFRGDRSLLRLENLHCIPRASLSVLRPEDLAKAALANKCGSILPWVGLPKAAHLPAPEVNPHQIL